MKRSYRFTSTLALLAAMGCAQGESADAPEGSSDVQPDAAAPSAPAEVTLSGGTAIQASLNGVISSADRSVGDVFNATVYNDVVDGDGRVIIPSGSAVQGTILEVRAAPDERSVGTLTLDVSSVTVRGQDYPLNASIDSLMTVHEERGLERADVIRVAGGAVAGSLIGRAISDDNKGAVIGGLVGAATGAAVSVLVKDQDIVLPAGARLMLTLREPLRVAVR